MELMGEFVPFHESLRQTQTFIVFMTTTLTTHEHLSRQMSDGNWTPDLMDVNRPNGVYRNHENMNQTIHESPQ
jgi:hypothetical protein